MAIGFEMLVQNLNELGISIFLHVVLFIAVYFGLLRKTEVLGDQEDVQGAAAVALGLLTALGIYSFVPAAFFTQFFGALSVLLVFFLGVLILLGMFGIEMGDLEMGENGYKVGILAILLIAVLGLAVFGPILGDMFGVELYSDQAVNLVLTLALIGIMGYMVRSIGGD